MLFKAIHFDLDPATLLLCWYAKACQSCHRSLHTGVGMVVAATQTDSGGAAGAALREAGPGGLAAGGGVHTGPRAQSTLEQSTSLTNPSGA